MKIVIACLVASLFAAACANDAAAPVPPTPPSSPIAVTATAPVEPVGARPLPGPAEELLYLRADESVWLYDTLTGEQSQIMPSGLCERWPRPEWNHDGSRIAVSCGQTVEGDTALFIFDAAGTQLARIEGSSLYSWLNTPKLLLGREDSVDAQDVSHLTLTIHRVDASEAEVVRVFPEITAVSPAPDGVSLAYYRAPGAPCAPACQTGLVIHNIADATERAYGDFVPYQWLPGGESIIVQNRRCE